MPTKPPSFCAFLAANAFSTMLPKLPRVGMTLIAGGVGVVLAATGTTKDLIGFFVMVGAAFGPIAGFNVQYQGDSNAGTFLFGSND